MGWLVESGVRLADVMSLTYVYEKRRVCGTSNVVSDTEVQYSSGYDNTELYLLEIGITFVVFWFVYGTRPEGFSVLC